MLQGAFAGEQRRVYAAIQAYARFGQTVQQTARPRPLAGLQSSRIETFRRAPRAHPHKQVHVELVIVMRRGEIGRAQIGAGNIGAQRLDDPQRRFDLRASLAQAIAVTLLSGQVVAHDGFQIARSGRLCEPEALLVEIECGKPFAHHVIDFAGAMQHLGRKGRNFLGACELQRLAEIVERLLPGAMSGVEGAEINEGMRLIMTAADGARADGARNLKRLIVMLERLPTIAQRVVNESELVERGRFPLPVIDLAKELQRLVEILERLLPLARKIKRPADPAEHLRLIPAFACRAPKLERLPEITQRQVAVAERAIDQSEVVKRMSFFAAAIDGAAQPERLAVGVERLLPLAYRVMNPAETQ